jgi:hypothetical protein
MIEPDVDESKYVYIVLQGRVDYKNFNFNTKTTMVAASYRSGEVFGDSSIQK